MIINGFKLESDDKLQRAIDNVGDNEDAILVQYDKLGGLITKDGVKIKSGSFYDVKTKKARVEPKVEEVVVKQKPRTTEEVIVEGGEKKKKSKK